MHNGVSYLTWAFQDLIANVLFYIGLPEDEMPLVPIIVGAVIGGALLIGLIVAISFYCIKKRRGIPHVDLNSTT